MNGEGGLIGIDAKGNAALVFNSAGMYRGLRNSDGENFVAIYADLICITDTSFKKNNILKLPLFLIHFFFLLNLHHF